MVIKYVRRMLLPCLIEQSDKRQKYGSIHLEAIFYDLELILDNELEVWVCLARIPVTDPIPPPTSTTTEPSERDFQSYLSVWRAVRPARKSVRRAPSTEHTFRTSSCCLHHNSEAFPTPLVLWVLKPFKYILVGPDRTTECSVIGAVLECSRWVLECFGEVSRSLRREFAAGRQACQCVNSSRPMCGLKRTWLQLPRRARCY